MVELEAKDVKTEDDIQGNTRPLSGRYHAVVKNVDESYESHNAVVVDFEVLAGTVPDQEGREISEWFWMTKKAKSRLQRLAIVLGLLEPGESAKEVEFVDGIGRQLMIEVVDDSYTKGGNTIETVCVAYVGFWSLLNKAVEDVPKDAEAMKLAGESGGSGGQAGTSEAATKTEANAAKKDKWKDL